MNVTKMIAVVQLYIFYHTNKEVNITPRLPEELPLLITAYRIADRFFTVNNIRWERIK